MEDPLLFSTDVDDRLAKERSRLDVLKESLQRSNHLTDNMLGIVTSFENRLSKLEETITPVYEETKNLQRRHENIEKTMSALDFVIEYYHVAEEVEPAIREGPSSGLEHYIECMLKLQKAVQFFNKHNPDSLEMSQVTTLFESGKDTLEREFKNILGRHSKAVPPVHLLDILAVDEEMPNDDDPASIDHLPNTVKNQLCRIAHWLLHCGYPTEYMTAYSQVRSSVLLKSLQILKDHLKSGSKDSASLSSGLMSHSPGMAGKGKGGKETPSKKAAKRIAFVRKASAMLMKQSLSQLEASGLKRSYGVTPEIRGEDSVEIDIDFYITSVSAFLKLIQSEFALMHGIIPEKFQSKCFEKLMQAAYESVLKEGELISSNIQKAIARHDSTAVLALFPVLRHLRSISPEFDDTLKGCQDPTRRKLASLIFTLDTTGAKALEEFVDSVRSDPDKQSNMPHDGTVHELTSNTMIFLEQLLAFESTAGAMLLSQDGNAQKSAMKKKLKLGDYITKVLSSLGLNLSNKSETYNDVTLRSIFMLNNYNYIVKSLKRTNMLELIKHKQPQIGDFYGAKIIEQKRIYSQSWSRVIHYINIDDKSPSQKASPEMKMKDKYRQAIKDKFSGFNKEMEDLFRIQKAYAIPDEELKESLKNDNKEFILPMYEQFLDKYKTVNFTKNPEKYIKYTVSDIDRFIKKLFDSAA